MENHGGKNPQISLSLSLKASPTFMGQKILLIAGLMASLGLASLGWAIVHHLDLKKFRRDYEQTRGMVSEVVTADSVHFYPRIRFKTLDNQRLHLKLRREEAKVKAGDSLAIYYDLVNPADAHLAMHHSERPIYTWAAVGIGLLLPALGVMGWLFWLRAKTRRMVATGRRVPVELLRAQPLAQWNFTGLRPQRLVCAWTNPAAPAKPVIMESQVIFGQLPEAIMQGKWYAYQDPADPTRHDVDLSGLPARMRLG
jgi:hypothetical protein